jgi:uncharacterized damage-inducible protein DinB
MSGPSLSTLVRHTVWANDEWIAVLEGCEAPPAELLRIMSHVLLGERAWFQRLAHQDPDRDIWRTLSAGALRDMHAQHAERYRALLDADVARMVEFLRFTGEHGRASVADILVHLTLHGAHHRGQLATRATACGISFPNTDFIQFTLSRLPS